MVPVRGDVIAVTRRVAAELDAVERLLVADGRFASVTRPVEGWVVGVMPLGDTTVRDMLPAPTIAVAEATQPLDAAGIDLARSAPPSTRYSAISTRTAWPCCSSPAAPRACPR